VWCRRVTRAARPTPAVPAASTGTIRSMRFLVVAILAPLVLAACGPGPGGPGTPRPDDVDRSGPVPPGLFEQILQDAASRTGLEPGQIAVASAESVTWSDGSLGCPEPGQMYTQALVPGYRVVLTADDLTLRYHASAQSFVLCPEDRARDPIEDGSAS
jgi:hypothetical protein